MPRRPPLPRLKKPRLSPFTRGPRELLQVLSQRGRQQAYPDPPGDWAGTLPEWTIYWAHREKGLIEGVDFSYQTAQEGGRHEYGGQVLDFVEYTAPLAINIQGLYWHYGRGTAQQARDQDSRMRLANYGLELIYIDEDHALRAPIYYLEEALRGIDHSRGASGV